jgi:D-3-phosphoglycerate dehydrogenase
MRPHLPKIVIPCDDPAQIQGSPHLERLKVHGEVSLYGDFPATEAEQLRRVQGARCIINSRGRVKWPGAVLRKLPELKMITVCGIGTDSIDLAAATELGIAVCNLPGKTAPIVAEHAVALMLAVAKRAWFQTESLKQGRWPNVRNVQLSGKTLGIVGTGATGAGTARLGRALGMKVQAWTFNPAPDRADKLGVSYVALSELLASSDVVSLHVRLSPETRGLIGRAELESMPQGAVLINTARAAIVDTKALADSLRSGHLFGAGVDVFDREPVDADNPLLGCEQVILTPHNADQTPEGIELLNAGCVDNVIAFLEGKPSNRVN